MRIRVQPTEHWLGKSFKLDLVRTSSRRDRLRPRHLTVSEETPLTNSNYHEDQHLEDSSMEYWRARRPLFLDHMAETIRTQPIAESE